MLQMVERAWSRAGFTVAASEDIHAEIWKKLVCNCAFSGTSIVTGFNVGQILDCPESREEIQRVCGKCSMYRAQEMERN